MQLASDFFPLFFFFTIMVVRCPEVYNSFETSSLKDMDLLRKNHQQPEIKGQRIIYVLVSRL